MSRPARRGIGAFCGVAALVGIVLAAAVLHAREESHPLPPSTERLLYLRSGRTADRLFLAFDAVAADVYWIRSIQHYGRDRRLPAGTPGKFELLQPLLDLTTTLDPRFNLAYRFGAIFLAIEPPDGPGRSDQAIALLEKGLRHNPNHWQYAYDIGFVHYWHTGDYLRAAEWFQRAAAMPNAPEWIAPLAAGTRAGGGDRAGARQLLAEMRQSPQRYIRETAERNLAQLDALDAIDRLQALVEHYRERAGTYPESWADLIRAGLLPGVPADVTGAPFAYDANAHRVRLGSSSSLSPLPPAFRHP